MRFTEAHRDSKKLINEMHANAFRVAGEQRDSQRCLSSERLEETQRDSEPITIRLSHTVEGEYEESHCVNDGQATTVIASHRPQ